MRLKDRVALIAGAGSGIGRAIAQRFAAEGAAVVVDDINDAGGEATARSIIDAGGRALFVHADISDEDQVASLMERALAFGGRLDVLVTSAVPDELTVI